MVLKCLGSEVSCVRSVLTPTVLAEGLRCMCRHGPLRGHPWMMLRNFKVKLIVSPLSHLVTNLWPPTEITSQAYNPLHPFKTAVIIACRNKSDFSYISCECDTARICCAAVPLVVYSRKPTTRQSCGHKMGQMDGRLQDHVIGSVPYTMRAVSIIDKKSVNTISTIFILRQIYRAKQLSSFNSSRHPLTWI